MTDKIISDSALSDFIIRVLSSTGMRIEDAAIVADVLTWANLRGVDSHVVARRAGYVVDLRWGVFDPVVLPVL